MNPFNPDRLFKGDSKPLVLPKELEKLEPELQKLADAWTKEYKKKQGGEASTFEEALNNSIRLAYEKYEQDLLTVEEYKKAGDLEKAKSIEEMAWMNFSDKMSQIKAKGRYDTIEVI